jgi:hypothetical protein
MRGFLAAAAMLLLAPVQFALGEPASDVHTVLTRALQRIQTADYRATGHLVRVDAGGARTSYPISLKVHWFPGILRVLCEIGNAGDARIHILLEMRPNGQNSIRVAHPGDKAPISLPFESWNSGPFGTGFSYEDFLEQEYFWPSQTVLEETKYGARDCDLLRSKPGPSDRTHYAEVRSWLDHNIGYPVYVEKSLKTSGTVKEFNSFGLRQNGGVWFASQVEVKTHGQAGSTLLIIDRGSTKANLELRDFSPEQLTRF